MSRCCFQMMSAVAGDVGAVAVAGEDHADPDQVAAVAVVDCCDVAASQRGKSCVTILLKDKIQKL